MGQADQEVGVSHVEALELSGPMLYSAEAFQLAEDLKDLVGRQLKREALAAAKRDRRNTVTRDDILDAFERVVNVTIHPDAYYETAEGTDNGR